MLIVALSSMGLPGLNGFVGEFVILLGAWGAGMPGGALSSFGGVWFAGIAAIGIIMAAVYILFMFQKMFLGPQGEIVDEVKSYGRGIRDLNWREILTITPLLIFIFWIGLYPAPFFDLMAPAVDKLVATLQTAALAMP